MKILDEQIEHFVQRVLAIDRAPSVARVCTEFQDDGEFVLISMEIDAEPQWSELTQFLVKAQNEALKFFPERDGEYSWMLNVVKDGDILRSIFGGDLRSPNSGHI